MDVCKGQLSPVADILKSDGGKNVVIAYEPVWAIGIIT
jgi:triosephosphate isomerase